MPITAEIPQLFEWRSLISDQLREAGMYKQEGRWSKCHKDGVLISCRNHDWELLVPYRCELRICSKCAPRHRLRFYKHYSRLGDLIRMRGGNRFRFLTLTIGYDKLNPIADLSDRVGLVLASARTLFHETWGQQAWIRPRVRRLIKDGLSRRQAVKQARVEASRSCWSGAMGAVEINTKTGFVHLHVLIYGWYVDIDKIKDAWERLTGYRGVYIQLVDRSVKGAVADILKYISKVPDQRSPEMAVAILKALSGRRRIFALGAFYRVLGAIWYDQLSRCPKCGGYLDREQTTDGWLAWRWTYDQRHAQRVYTDSS